MTGASGNHSISLSLGWALYLALAFRDWGLATCQVRWGGGGGGQQRARGSEPPSYNLVLHSWERSLVKQ